MIYDVDYFIRMFGAIPEQKWCVGKLKKDNSMCANGWCGVSSINNKANKISFALWDIFKVLAYGDIQDQPYTQYSNIAANINNGNHPNYNQPTPKQRILAALNDIKLMQPPTIVISEQKIKEVIKYASISETLKEPITETQLN